MTVILPLIGPSIQGWLLLIQQEIDEAINNRLLIIMIYDEAAWPP